MMLFYYLRDGFRELLQHSVAVEGIKGIPKLAVSQPTEQFITDIKQFEMAVHLNTVKCVFNTCMFAIIKGTIECLDFISVVVVASKTVEGKGFRFKEN